MKYSELKHLLSEIMMTTCLSLLIMNWIYYRETFNPISIVNLLALIGLAISSSIFFMLMKHVKNRKNDQ